MDNKMATFVIGLFVGIIAGMCVYFMLFED